MFGIQSERSTLFLKPPRVLNWSATPMSLFASMDKSKCSLMCARTVTHDSLMVSLLVQTFNARITVGNSDLTANVRMCPPLARMPHCRLLNSLPHSCKKSTTSFGFHHLNPSPTSWRFLNGMTSHSHMFGCPQWISKQARLRPLTTSLTSHIFRLFMPEHSVQTKICSSPITPPSVVKTVGVLLLSTPTSLKIMKTR